jgi:tRNA(Ile2) C34 agmatinyltransferase TiaS
MSNGLHTVEVRRGNLKAVAHGSHDVSVYDLEDDDREVYHCGELDEAVAWMERVNASTEPAPAEPPCGPACPVCGGEGKPLGRLGRRVHFRCRDCGSDFSEAV